MNHQATLFLIFLFLADRSAPAQQVLYSFEPSSSLSGFQLIPVGDSLLLSYKQSVEGKKIMNSFWITDSLAVPNSLQDEVVDGSRWGDDTYLYSIQGKGEKMELKAKVLHASNGTVVQSGESIRLPGPVVGWYRQKNLFLVILSDDGKKFIRLEIRGMTRIGQKSLSLPLNLGSYMMWDGPIDFIPGSSQVSLFAGRGKVKIYRYDKFYITVDGENTSGKPGTGVMEIDTAITAVRMTFFAAENIHGLSSFLLDGKLFRSVIRKKELKLTVFDLASAKVIGATQKEVDSTDFDVYFRYGKKYVITNKEHFLRMMKTSQVCDPMLSVVRVDGKYFLQCGTYFNEKGIGSPGPSSLGAAALIPMIVGTIIYQSMKAPGINRYFYYEWDESSNEFRLAGLDSPTLRDKIDKYEIKYHIRFEYKEYVPFRNGIAGIYWDSRINTRILTVVYFQ